VTIRDARQTGKEVPLLRDVGTYAVLSGPAEFSITLDAGLPLKIEAGRAGFELPAVPAGTVQLTLVIPGDHTNVTINPGLITSRNSSDGRTTVEATLPAGQPASIFWASREVAAPPAVREPRFLSDVKTLVTVGEAQLSMAALADITVLQGEPSQFELPIPAGYEVTGATGAGLESSDVQSGVLILKVGAAAQRGYQFLISLERPADASKTEIPLPGFQGAQRETGEVLVEGEGVMELVAKERGSLKRMDLRETNPYLRSLAHDAPQAAFRCHRQPAEAPGLSLEWVRFPDSSVLAAVAQQAVVTTMVTPEGRSLTEVKLVLRNQAQPFLKVDLPAGASILSADVAGERVKPVEGQDGTRVPLLRPGFRPTDSYTVSFVFLHSGAPFAKKGDGELALPKMGLPVALVEWEVFLPERYKVRDFGGDALAAGLLPANSETAAEMIPPPQAAPPPPPPATPYPIALAPGQLGGLVVDPAGALVPGATVSVVLIGTGLTRTARADLAGRWVVSGLSSGSVRITVDVTGFRKTVEEVSYDASRPRAHNVKLDLGSTNESVMVSAEAVEMPQRERPAKLNIPPEENASVNVLNLQRRVAGVLPIPVDVPRAGRSFRFARPLVIDEETKVTFRYTTK